MTEYADLPQEVKDQITEEDWNASIALIPGVAEQAQIYHCGAFLAKRYTRRPHRH